jgi:superfamily II DNA/RNA helicase
MNCWTNGWATTVRRWSTWPRARAPSGWPSHLAVQGWSAVAFHAGLKPPDKRRIQDEFIAGQVRVICATNAFGMGIDKEDVRMVVHADMPGSLENYLQEAGRAGRDRAPADCVLLYSDDDAETQFALSAISQLTPRDIRQILRGLRRSKRKSELLVITSGELLRDEADRNLVRQPGQDGGYQGQDGRRLAGTRGVSAARTERDARVSGQTAGRQSGKGRAADRPRCLISDLDKGPVAGDLAVADERRRSGQPDDRPIGRTARVPGGNEHTDPRTTRCPRTPGKCCAPWTA